MNKTIYSKDLAANKMFVAREFAGTLEQVWQAWTEPELLDQWWAPRPWKAKTKTMDFREGGYWLYAMEGPNGDRHWSRADYKKIVKLKNFLGVDCFCDENGKANPELPGSTWNVVFSSVGKGTKVEVDITFPSKEDLETIVKMGFQEGFAAAHNNLDELLAK